MLFPKAQAKPLSLDLSLSFPPCVWRAMDKATCLPQSGKSLSYLVPTLHEMASNAAARAIFVFPTKSLAQDQLRSIRTLTQVPNTPLFGLQVAASGEAGLKWGGGVGFWWG